MRFDLHLNFRPIVLGVLLAMTFAARGQTKPWVEDFPAFASEGDGARWVVGRSTSPCLSEAEAFEAAARDAREQLAARVRPLVGRVPDVQGEEWLRRRLAVELVVADRSVSRVHRPYGDVWSEAVLVDAPRARLSRVAREYSDWRNERHRTVRGAAASVFGLSVVILLIYTALNAVTKGYFRGRLRVAAALTLAVGLLAAVWAIRGVG